MTLRPGIKDINSLIEAEIDFDGQQYKIWLPVMFIRFSSREGTLYSSSTKVVTPSRIFSNENQAKRLIPVLNITTRGEATVWV